MGYTGLNDFIKDGKWKSEFINDDGSLKLDKIQSKLQSKRERSITTLNQNDNFKNSLAGNLKDGTVLSDNLTNEEINALASNMDNNVIQQIIKSSDDADKKLAKLRFELKKITMGDFATANEYLSVFASSLNISTKNVKELKEALNNTTKEGVFGWTQLNNIASNFGIKINQLIDNIAILGDIDIFGRTSKSLPEITA
jgi:predicted house-cleaning noncanonical NTP pyrophosphatase (MazG superfamily)